MEHEVGILYKCFQISDDTFILKPICLKEGMSINGHFYCENKQAINTVDSLLNGFQSNLIDGITTVDVLEDYYDAKDEPELVKEYYFETQSILLTLVKIKEGKILKRRLSEPEIFKKQEQEIYSMLGLEPTVTLNIEALEELRSRESLEEVRKKLDILINTASENEEFKRKGFGNILIENQKVVGFNVGNHIKKIEEPAIDIEPEVAVSNVNPNKESKKEEENKPWFTLMELRDYLMDRIMGHEDELKKVATIVYNNYKAQEGDTILSMLIAGQTGSGKTITANTVCEFLGVASAKIDCSEIVPQGYVGPKIIEKLQELAEDCQYDQAKINKSVIIGDEFDKIALTGLDLKSAARFELLKFIEGKKYTIPVRGSYSRKVYIDTARIMKFFLGAFGDAIKNKQIGFGGQEIQTVEDLEKKILTNTEFEDELLSRIQILIPYKPLTTEDKKRIILTGRNSIYLENKRRILRDYGVEVMGDESFSEGVIEALGDKISVRQMNNIIFQAILPILYELGTNEGKYKKLVLSKDTIQEGRFDLS